MKFIGLTLLLFLFAINVNAQDNDDRVLSKFDYAGLYAELCEMKYIITVDTILVIAFNNPDYSVNEAGGFYINSKGIREFVDTANAFKCVFLRFRTPIPVLTGHSVLL